MKIFNQRELNNYFNFKNTTNRIIIFGVGMYKKEKILKI